MKRIKLLFCILLSFTSSPIWAKTEFEKLLEKNENYKGMVDKYDQSSQSKNSTTTEVLKDVKQLEANLDKYLEEKKAPAIPSSAELQSQAQIDMEHCSTCQNYLNLSGDINKILSRMDPAKDLPLANTTALQLNNLKFLYYAVKSDMFDGVTSCKKYGNSSTKETKFPGTFKLLAEEAFDLPNVHEVQYIPEGGKEVIYLYRGVGSDSNKVYEVHMMANGKGYISLYHYNPSSAEKLAQDEYETYKKIRELTKKSPKELPKEDNYIDVTPDFKTRDAVILTDVEFLNAGSKTELSEDLVLGTKSTLSYNQQETELNFADSKGESWIKVNAKNKTEGKSDFVTVVPMSLSLDEKSKLNLNTTLKSEVGIVHKDKAISNAHAVNMNLTDHDNKYLEVEVYEKPADEYRKISFSNKYSLGNSNSVGMNYSKDTDGKREYSIANHTNLGDYGTLKTEFGESSSNRKFISAQQEVAIGKTSTLSIGVRTEDGKTGRDTSANLVFQSRF